MTPACVKLPLHVPTGIIRMKLHAAFLVLLAGAWGCTPTVQVAAPKEPIEINMNLRIEHNIRVQVDRELEDMFEKDSELF